MPRAAVTDKDREQQTQQHAQRWQHHSLHYVDALNITATLGHVCQQNIIEEDTAEANRQEHVRCNQTEGQHTGHQTPVQAQAPHHVQQRRHQQGNERDMNRQDILRRNRYGQQHQQHHRQEA